MYQDERDTAVAARPHVRASVDPVFQFAYLEARTAFCALSQGDPQWCNADVGTIQRHICQEDGTVFVSHPVRGTLCGTQYFPAPVPWPTGEVLESPCGPKKMLVNGQCVCFPTPDCSMGYVPDPSTCDCTPVTPEVCPPPLILRDGRCVSPTDGVTPPGPESNTPLVMMLLGIAAVGVVGFIGAQKGG